MVEQFQPAGAAYQDVKRFFWAALGYQGIVFLIVCLVIWAIWGKEDPIILYVPAFVLLWGAVGGMASILYKMLKGVDETILRQAVVKPIIGAIFGAVAFLGAKIGLVVVSSGEAGKPSGELLSLVAFLGGFSDKFTLDILDLLVARSKKERKEGAQDTTASEPVPATGNDKSRKGPYQQDGG